MCLGGGVSEQRSHLLGHLKSNPLTHCTQHRRRASQGPCFVLQSWSGLPAVPREDPTVFLSIAFACTCALCAVLPWGHRGPLGLENTQRFPGKYMKVGH